MIVLCPKCEGTGKIRERVTGYESEDKDCKFCNGKGRLRQITKYEKLDR